jgi:hypothetical protein
MRVPDCNRAGHLLFGVGVSLDDPDRSLHAELGLLAAVLGAKGAGEDVCARLLGDELLPNAAG